MGQGSSTETPLQLQLSSGRLSARRWGSPEAPLLLCVPGISQDERSFEYLGSRLGSATRQVVAVSPRGRGGSETTASGSYGWPAHARDVAEIASLLGQPKVDVMGWSFGAFVTLQLAADAPRLLGRAVLIDAVGRPEPSSLGPIMAGLGRLSTVFGSVEEYTTRVLSAGVADGCREAWVRYLSEDLVRDAEGLRTRTSSDAVLEDAQYGASHDPYALWPALLLPVLLVRAAQPVLPGLGFLVSEADRERFRAEVRFSQVVEVDANHYCVGYLGETAWAVERFLDE